MHNPNQAKDARPWTPLAAALIVAAFAPLLAGCSPEPAAEGSAGNDPSLIARENEHPQAVEAEQVIGATYIRAHETSRTFLISGTEHKSSHLGPGNRPRTHNTRLYCNIESTFIQIFSAKSRGCGSNSLHFSVSSHISQSFC